MTLVTCPACAATFDKTTKCKTNRCPPCRRSYEIEWRRKRKEEGRRVITRRNSLEWERAYTARRRESEVVRRRIAERAAERRLLPSEVPKNMARMQVRRAIVSGALVRQPCEQCGNPKSQARHDDYGRPLDVRWLCPLHHARAHRAEGRQP